MAKDFFKILPKWRNFTKSGHTDEKAIPLICFKLLTKNVHFNSSITNKINWHFFDTFLVH